MESQRALMNEIAKKLAIDPSSPSSLDKFYAISNKEMIAVGGVRVLALYGNSLLKLLENVFPEKVWDPLRFAQVPRNYWSRLENQRKFMDDLKDKLRLTGVGPELWYGISTKDITSSGGRGLLARYSNSLSQLLTAVYPELTFDPLKFSKAPQNYWSQLENQKGFMKDLMKSKFKFEELSGWYKVSHKQMVQSGGGPLLSHYGGSLYICLLNVFPEHKWEAVKFPKVPQKFWNDKANQRLFLESIGKELGIVPGVAELSKWYNVSTKDLLEHGGYGILKKYNNSLSKLLSEVFTEAAWDPLKFQKVRQNHWVSIENQRQFMHETALKLNFPPSELSGWYKVSTRQFLELGGGGILALYNNSLKDLLEAVYPEGSWDPLKFKKVPHKYWELLPNHIKFMNELHKKLGFKEGSWENWYHVSNDTILQNGGGGLLRQYNNSLSELLVNVFPEYPWQLWRFPRKSDLLNSDPKARSECLSSIERSLDIKEPKDWNRVTMEQLETIGMARPIKSLKGGLITALSERYPSFPYKEELFQSRGFRRANQSWLSSSLVKLFPNEQVLQDYSHPNIIFPASSLPLQLDIFLPSLNIAFEYQGKQHYEQLNVYGDASYLMSKDLSKKALCKENGITLIEVPYWWSKKRSELLGNIFSARPDLFETKLLAFRDEALEATHRNEL